MSKPLKAHYGREWGRADSETLTWPDVERAIAQETRDLLRECRDELRRLNQTFACRNFLAVPQTLNRIDKRLAMTRKLGKGRPR